MQNSTVVNPQIINMIDQVHKATMLDDRVTISGAGKAYQSVAQSTAIAVQDATDALRNISTIATTAAGVALAQYMATGEDKYAQALTKAQSMMTSATSDYSAIGQAAVGLLNSFPHR